MYAFVNHEIIPEKEASIHVGDLAVQRGYGVFDFFKTSDGHTFFLNDYLDRFYASAEYMRLPVALSREELTAVIKKLTELNHFRQSGTKVILTGGYSEDGYHPATPNLIITQHPLALPPVELVNKGVQIITHDYVRDIPSVKTINYTMGIWLTERVKKEGAYDVLYCKDNVVSEFPRSNFFVVTKDKTVATAAKNVLHGITRKNVLQLAEKYFNASVDDITLDDVYNADEAFITSTTKRVLPVIAVNGRKIGTGKPGEVSMQLLDHLIALEQEDARKGVAASRH